MEAEERNLKRATVNLSQRDKELERLKSLQVVSALNKNFEEHSSLTRPTSTILTTLTPSSSTTTDSENIRQNQIRSNSVSSNKRPNNIDVFYSNPKLSEKETEEYRLVTSSPIDADKEDLTKRLSELEALYEMSKKEINTLQGKSEQQIELLVLQNRLISQMTEEMDELTTQDLTPSNSIKGDGPSLTAAQAQLSDTLKELNLLKAEKVKYETIFTELLTQLKESDEKLNEMETFFLKVKNESKSQAEYIDTKVQSLMNKVAYQNETIQKLQQEIEHKERLLATALSSPRPESSISTESSSRKSILGRWRGSALPPASPPPSLPLPPIPSPSTPSRPRSILSELSKGSQIDTSSKIEVARSPSIRSTTDPEPITEEAAYYKEFTDQLQERLSISKEIDELRVWEPSDFDEIQRKIDSETWSVDDENSEKENGAFWKGMKKRLKV